MKTVRATVKTAQRRCYSSLTGTKCSFLCVVLVGGALNMVLFALHFNAGCVHCDMCKYGGYGSGVIDNIGMEDFSRKMCMPPIDVVYTWVNGSDPEWLKEMEYYRYKGHNPSRSLSRAKWNESNIFPGPSRYNASLNSSALGANFTVLASNGSEPSVGSSNRYRDNHELKYSFRSLFKYAPWIRKVFLVTSGQVPNWLNTAHPRIKVFSHQDIFLNSSWLPTFSSPAIETQLHRIPGLSKKFIYFNDDVMLGAPVWPEDFFNIAGAQKVFLSWDVPKCNPGCTDSWVGDGQCDLNCNVSRCMWDLGDCFNVSKKNAYGYRQSYSSSSSHGTSRSWAYCAVGCPSTWIGDKVCDKKCDSAACGFDGGDCGIKEVWGGLKGFELPVRATGEAAAKPLGMAANATDLALDPSRNITVHVWSNASGPGSNNSVLPIAAAETAAKIEPVALGQYDLPQGCQAVYFNLSVSGRFEGYGVDVVRANHNNPDAIGSAVVLKHFGVMVVIFRNEDYAQELGWTSSTIKVELALTKTVIVGNSSVVEDSQNVWISFSTLSNLKEIPVSKNSTTTAALMPNSNVNASAPPRNGSETTMISIVGDGKNEPFPVASNVSFFSTAGNRSEGVHFSSRNGRRLLGSEDTYGDSLVKVNMMYAKEFGASSRKVPAHMPHMIDRDVMDELQDKYEKEFWYTGQQKFRTSADMQFAFSYFHWVINRKSKINIENIFRSEIDTDQNGYLDPNEVRTLAAMITGKTPPHDLLDRLTANCSTLDELKMCKDAIETLSKNFRRPKTHIKADLDEVTFQMIGDNFNETKEKLDSIRAKKTKFICVNDDMHNPALELEQMLADFYKSMFPKPSPFELPPGQTNGGRNIFEIRRHKVRQVPPLLQSLVLCIAIIGAVGSLFGYLAL